MFFVFFLGLNFSSDVVETEELARNGYISKQFYNALVVKNDFNTAFEMYKEHIKQEDLKFDPIIFWFYRRFLHSQLDAYVYLNSFVVKNKIDNLTNLFMCRLSSDGMYVRDKTLMPNHMISAASLDVAKKISESYTKQKLYFKEVTLLGAKKIKGEYSKKDILLLVHSKNRAVSDAFFNMVENEEISVEEALPHLKKLAAIDPRCYRILGDVAWYKYNENPTENESYADKAMDYYWAGSEKSEPECRIGLARILFEVYHDEVSAKKHLEKALRKKDFAEAHFLLWKMLRLANPMAARNHLTKAATKGFIPAMTEYFLLGASEPTTNSVRSVLSILKFHPYIMQINKMMKKAYDEKNYKKAFLLNSFLNELNMDNARENILYLYENYKSSLQRLNESFSKFEYLKTINTEGKTSENITKEHNNFNFLTKPFVDVVYFDAIQFQEKTTEVLGHNLNSSDYLNKLGKCHYNGIGTEVDYEMAYACFKSAKANNLQAKYYEADMLEKGLGIKRNPEGALEIISQNTFGQMSLLFYVLKIRFFIKTLGLKILLEYWAKICVGFLTILIMKITYNLNR